MNAAMTVSRMTSTTRVENTSFISSQVIRYYDTGVVQIMSTSYSSVPSTYISTDHVVQHRVKPTNLIANLTGLPVQSRHVLRGGIAVLVTRVRNNYYKYWQETTTRLGRNFAYGSISPYLAPPGNWETQMRLKIKGEAVNLADTIGEYRESVNAVKGGADVLKRAYRRARELRARGGRPPKVKGIRRVKRWDDHVVDVVTGDLAIKFGVKPWIQLALDSREAVQTAATKGILRRLVVTVPSEKSMSVVQSGVTYDVKAETSVRAICYVRTTPYYSAWTAGNPLEAIWAGVTGSFMVDWFWDLGSWLSSIDAMNSVRSITGTLTTRQRSRAEGKSIDSGYALEKNPLWSYHSHTRSVINTVALGSLPEFRLPPANWDTFDKLVSAVEILASMKHGSARMFKRGFR